MTALDELLADFASLRNGEAPSNTRDRDNLAKRVQREQAQLLALIQTLALALALAQGVPLDECEGGLLGEARAVLGRYATKGNA